MKIIIDGKEIEAKEGQSSPIFAAIRTWKPRAAAACALWKSKAAAGRCRHVKP